MANYPKQVLLREDGPREGFQMHKDFVPTEKKLALIQQLSQTGITSIEVTSFVRADKVPQLADAEEICKNLPNLPNVRYRALYLNQKGFERVLAFPNIKPEGYVLIAASEPFLKANNNQTIDDALALLPTWFDLFKKHKIPFERIMLSTAFGDHLAGKLRVNDTLQVCKRALDVCEQHQMLPEEVTFADTTGYGNPNSVQELIIGFKKLYPNIEVGLHLHDTRGTGMANVLAGLEVGVARFDCSVGGLGGCPFTTGAAGNVPTEDVAFLCQELGIETGIDLRAYIECAKFAETLVGRKLPGKLKDAGMI